MHRPALCRTRSVAKERAEAEAGQSTSPRRRDVRPTRRALRTGVLGAGAVLALLGSGLAASPATVAGGGGGAGAGAAGAGATRLAVRTAWTASAPGRPSHAAAADAPVILIRRPNIRTRRAKHRRASSAVRPAVRTQPRSVTVAATRPASFTATASGTPAPTAQWQRSTNHGRTWTAIAAAHQLTYKFTAGARENGDQYRAMFSNQAGSATTGAAILSVSVASSGSAPQVTSEPVNVSVTSGASATFTAAASGNPAPSVQWEVSTNGGGSWADLAGAISPSLSFSAGASGNGDQYRAVFSNRVGSATSSAATLIVPAETLNWSGYAVSGEAFSDVAGSWTVPSVTCTGDTTTYSSQWIGIDGYDSDTVQQDGTEADCILGEPHYGAWYELYGDDAVNDGDEVPLPNSTYPVSPRDALTASVSLSGSMWTLTVADLTANWTYSIKLPSWTPAPKQSSAEWIVERPQVGSLTALSNFGSVSFTTATAVDSATSGSISAFSPQPLEMVGSTLLAVPGGLDPAGRSFTDTWQASS